MEFQTQSNIKLDTKNQYQDIFAQQKISVFPPDTRCALHFLLGIHRGCKLNASTIDALIHGINDTYINKTDAENEVLAEVLCLLRENDTQNDNFSRMFSEKLNEIFCDKFGEEHQHGPKRVHFDKKCSPKMVFAVVGSVVDAGKPTKKTYFAFCNNCKI